MIEKHPKTFDQWNITCDKCQIEQKYEASSFYALVDQLKEDKWRTIKTEEGYNHFCYKCRDKINS